jgi:hypothetical protein
VEGDLKEVVGALMRVLGGGRISRADVEDLAFEADGDLQVALNEAYIRLLEFAYDCDAGLYQQKLSEQMRTALEYCLNEIIRCADQSRAKPNEVPDAQS